MAHMIHHKYPPSTDLWLCVHGVGYPDICSECSVTKERLVSWNNVCIVLFIALFAFMVWLVVHSMGWA